MGLITGFFTPEDARKKLCPFFRHVANEDAVLQHNSPALTRHDGCMAEHCIAWRPSRLGEPDKTPGFCGVAGDPRKALAYD